MSGFKVKIKDVKEFVRVERKLYASGDGKKLYIALRAGPNVERYIVETKSENTGFTKLGDAVRRFNSL